MTDETKSIAKQVKKLSEFREVSNILIRKWMGLLTPQEFCIVMFIHGRTLGYGHAMAGIAEDHFLYGVKDGTTEEQCASAPKISRSTLYRVLASLKDKGLVKITSGKRYKWSEYGFDFDILRGVTVRHQGCHSETSGVSPVGRKIRSDIKDMKLKAHLSKDKFAGGSMKTFILKVRRKPVKAKPQSIADIKANLETMQAVTRSKSEDLKRKRIKAGKIDGYIKHWRDVCTEAFPSVPNIPWRITEVQAFKGLWKRSLWNHTNPEDFIEMVVGNWDYIIKHHFSYMKNAPSLPTPMFFIKFFPMFVDAYNKMANSYKLKTYEQVVKTTVVKTDDKELQKLQKEIEARDAQIEELKYDNTNLKRIVKSNPVRQAQIIPLPVSAEGRAWTKQMLEAADEHFNR